MKRTLLTRIHPICVTLCLSVHLSVHQWMCSSIVDVNTTSDRLIIEQLGHEITQKDRGRDREMEKGDKRWRKGCRERVGGGVR